MQEEAFPSRFRPANKVGLVHISRLIGKEEGLHQCFPGREAYPVDQTAFIDDRFLHGFVVSNACFVSLIEAFLGLFLSFCSQRLGAGSSAA